MSPRQQQIALARLDGWLIRSYCRKNYLVSEDFARMEGRRWDPEIEGQPVHYLSETFQDYRHIVPPDYLRDLDLITKLVLKFRYPDHGTTWAQQQSWLEQIVARELHIHRDSVSFQWECQNAIAPWKCEALLRATRTWVESPIYQNG